VRSNLPSTPLNTLISLTTRLYSFLPAIDAEQREDEAILNERLSTWPLKRLKEEGYAMTEMGAYWQTNLSFGKPTASFAVGPGVELGNHRFE
jgi:hypothetical protein